MRGLRTKLRDLNISLFTLSSTYDIIFVETWLSDDISVSELPFKGYNVFRCDRSNLTSSYARGGGVLIAVKNNIKCSLLVPTISGVEHIFVKLHISGICCFWCSLLSSYDATISLP